jgi:hypothetical protein
MFPVGCRVRLLRDAFGVPRGTEGIVIGSFRCYTPTYYVEFPTAEREVLAEDLEPVAVALGVTLTRA